MREERDAEEEGTALVLVEDVDLGVGVDAGFRGSLSLEGAFYAVAAALELGLGALEGRVAAGGGLFGGLVDFVGGGLGLFGVDCYRGLRGASSGCGFAFGAFGYAAVLPLFVFALRDLLPQRATGQLVRERHVARLLR